MTIILTSNEVTSAQKTFLQYLWADALTCYWQTSIAAASSHHNTRVSSQTWSRVVQQQSDFRPAHEAGKRNTSRYRSEVTHVFLLALAVTVAMIVESCQNITCGHVDLCRMTLNFLERLKLRVLARSSPKDKTSIPTRVTKTKYSYFACFRDPFTGWMRLS